MQTIPTILLLDPCRLDSKLHLGLVFLLQVNYSLGFQSNFDTSVYLDAIPFLHGHMPRTTHIHSDDKGGGGGGQTTMNIYQRNEIQIHLRQLPNDLISFTTLVLNLLR